MKRSELEKHIGESVEVKLFDGDTMQGVLRKTGTEEVRNNPNLYLKGGYYFLSHKDTYVCKSCLFRVSHIKSLTDIEDLKKQEKEDIKAMEDELCLLTYAVLACLKGLKEQGCNGPVTEAIGKIEKHINQKAHGQET